MVCMCWMVSVASLEYQLFGEDWHETNILFVMLAGMLLLHTLILLLMKMCFSDNDRSFYGWSTSLLSGPGLLNLGAPILCESVNLVKLLKVVIACNVKIIELKSVSPCLPVCLWSLMCVCVCVCVCVCCPCVVCVCALPMCCLCVCMQDRLL